MGKTEGIWNAAEDTLARNPRARRSDVIVACLKKGYSHGSVVTQVNAWIQARKIFTARGFRPGVVGDARPAVQSRRPAKAKPKTAAKAKPKAAAPDTVVIG